MKRHTLFMITAVCSLSGASHARAAIDLVFDYTLDTNNFFDNTTANGMAARARLEQAAGFFESAFADTLDAIVPSAPNTWTAIFPHPGDGTTVNLVDLTIPADQIRVYAGARNLAGSTLGQGGPGGFSAGGFASFLTTLGTRGEGATTGPTAMDFGPWGGAITFDTFSNPAGTIPRSWHFGDTTTGLDGSENDFLSVAVHELGHLLGFGTAESFDNLITGTSFTGTTSTMLFGSNPPLSPDLGHWANGTSFLGQETAMDPSITIGTRKLLTLLDLAAFKDLGWEATVPEPATAGMLFLLSTTGLFLRTRRR